MLYRLSAVSVFGAMDNRLNHKNLEIVMEMNTRSFSRSILFSLFIALSAGCSESGQEANNDMAKREDPVVETHSGKVSGIKEQDISIFKGIPYAKPPLANNRWRSPQPVDNWKGVREATGFGHDCMQQPFPSDAAPLGETPAEDCLYVNVWTPDTEPEVEAPVVLWIHGGGYVNGGASPAVYDGSNFAKAGIVFVSFNYRLGRFGFFAHPALTAAQEGPLANYGFEDQIAALKWVHDNIAAFGGNPSQITIMGESAGGGSVHNLLQNPGARGLFHSAIIMSGGGRSLMGERSLHESQPGRPSAEQIGINMAKKHGITGTGADALVALRSLPAEAVTDGLNLTDLMRPPVGEPTYVGGPVKDGTIVVGSTEQLLQDGKVAAVPVMIGTTSADIGFNPFTDKEALFASFGPFAEQARQAYDPDGDADIQAVGYQVGQDRSMQEPARYAAKMMTRLDVPVYLYRFGYVAESIRNGMGAMHASDIPFFFNTANIKYPQANEQDLGAANLAFRYVVNFIKKGDPNGDGLPTWKVYSPQEGNIMALEDEEHSGTEIDPFKNRLDVVEQAQNARSQP